MKSFWKKSRHASPISLRRKSRRVSSPRLEMLEARQLLAVAVDDAGIAAQEGTPTTIEALQVLANDLTATPGAVIEYDANNETDNIWNNSGAANNGFLDIDLGTPTLIDSSSGLSTSYTGIEQAYRFDGDDGGTFNNIQALDTGDPTGADASWELVFRPTAGVMGQQVLWELGGTGAGTAILYNGDDESIQFLIDGGDDTGQLLRVDTAAGSVSTTEFTHLVGVYNQDTGATDRLDIYLNGTLVASDVEVDNDVDDWAGTNGDGVGTVSGNVGTNAMPANYQGDMTLLRLYDTALTSNQVADNFNALESPIVAVSPASTAGGNVTLNADGSITYDPNGQFAGLAFGQTATDTFTYTIEDGTTLMSTATVTVTVIGAVEAISGDLAFTVDENTGATFQPTDFPGEFAVPGAAVFYDADPENDQTWNNTGTATDPALDIDLTGSPLTSTSSAYPGINQAYQFDGVNSGGTLLDLQTGVTPDPSGASATWEVVFRPDVQGSGSQLLYETGGSGNGMAIVYNAGDKSISFVLDGGNDTNDLLRVDTAAGTVFSNEFNHLVGIYEKDTDAANTDLLNVYLNGVLVGSANNTTTDDWDGGDDAGLGILNAAAAIGLTPAPYQGEMNLFRFYDSSITPTEVLANFRNVTETTTIAAVTSPTTQGGTVTLNMDGTVDYTVPPAFDSLQIGDTATDTFTFTIDDGTGTTTTGTANVTINGANDAPVANDDMLGMTDEETPITVPAPPTIDSSSYQATVLGQNPIGFWLLNEETGTLADNQGTAGDPLDGAYEAGVTQGVQGFDPNGDLAAQFNDAADSQVNITGYAGITGTNARTVSAWVNTTAANADIMGWGVNSNGEKWTFRIQNGNGTVGAIRVEVNGGYIVGNTVVNDGQWHHVAFTFEDDGSPDVEDVKLYVDGQLDAEVGGLVAPSASLSNVVNTSAGGEVEIGESPNNNNFFTGPIDDVSLFDRALSSAEIQAQFEAGIVQGPDILANDTDPENDPLAIQSFDMTSAAGATITLDTIRSIGNVGMINGLEIAPQTISLGGDFVNPVVIAQPLSHNGGDPSVARILNVDAAADEFTVQLIESPNLDNTGHLAEDFFFVVMEAGQHQLPDGTLIEVGTIDTTDALPGGSFDTVTFSTAFSGTPAVLTQTQTNNEPGTGIESDLGSGYLQTRQQNVTAGGFEVSIEEAESEDGVHASETVGYIAIEQGTSFTFGGANFEAITTAQNIDENFTQVNFAGSYSTPPLLVAALATYAGVDPTHLRYQNLTNTGVEFQAEEDTSSDTELTHAAEAASYLAFSQGGEILAYPPGTNPGQFTYDPSGALDFIPAGEVFTDTFTYTLVDALGATSTATVSVQVTGVNDDPTAVDDSLNAAEDMPTNLDVLANDTDPDIDGMAPDDTLTVISVDNSGTTGMATVNPGGADVSYDPQGNFENLDDGDTATTTFTYTLEDGSGVTSSATVTVIIDGANDAPLADANGPYTIDEGQSLTLDASASSDADDGETLTYAWDIDGDGMFDDATGVNPTVPFSTLQAFADGPGSFDVSVQVSDGDLTGTATATVTVDNAPPVATVTPAGSQAFPNTDFEITVSADDPADADDAAPFFYELDFNGDGTVDRTMTGPASGVTFTVQFQSIGTITVMGFATDKDGGRSDAATATVNIVPVGIDADGNLVAAGTNISDRIIFTSSNGGVQVRYNNVFYPLGGGSFSLGPGARLIANGAGGNDMILVAGNLSATAEIDGGIGNDYIAASSADDILIGGEGNDIILGGNGDNLIIGDTRDSSGVGGSDRLEGGDDDDTIFGGAGNDRLNGRSGDDILDGGADNDFLFGDLGNDLLVGRVGADTINGHFGNDVIIGGDSADQLFGSGDQDLLVGGLGADRLRGDSGDDVVVGDTSDLDDDIEAALDSMLASMTRQSLSDADPAVAQAVEDWFNSNEFEDFQPFGNGDGASDELTGGTGVDTFHARSTDRLRDFREGETML